MDDLAHIHNASWYWNYSINLDCELMSIYKKFSSIPVIAKVNPLRKLQSQTQEELDALLPSVLDRAFKGEL